MTGEWEARLHDIEAGRLDAGSFMTGIAEFTRAVIVGSEPGRVAFDTIGTCPKCGTGEIVEGQRGFGCNRWRDGCDYVLWKDYQGHAIDERQARELFQRRLSLRPFRLGDESMVLALTERGQPTHLLVPRREHQRPAGGSAAKRGGKPAARRAADTRGGTQRGGTQAKATRRQSTAARPTAAKTTAAKTPPGDKAPVCPLCGGAMVEREASFCCASWRAGCGFAIHKTIAGKKISKAMARKLLTKGQTQLLKGFTSRANKKFDARLKLEDGRVKFEFGG
jgi:DNA topoisomerase-3